jgi:hypothetical protein
MNLNLLLLLTALVNAATAQEAAVNLGTACNYAILAKSGISTVPTSAITGSIAVSPIAATAMTGFGLVLDLGGQYSTASQFTGKAYGASYGGATASALTVAVLDMQAAYTDAASRLNANATRINPGGGDISGMTMTPGVYTFQVGIGINSDVYFDAFGDSSAVFILQTTGNILQASSTRVTLQGGARAENIFWQVAGNVAIGVGAHFVGIILAATDVTFFTGASLDGLILAQTACVLQMATITQADGTCGISTAPVEATGAPADEGGQASAMATITVIATTIDPITLTSTTTSTTITKTTVVTALETTKTTNTMLSTTTSVDGSTPVTVTDQQEPIVEVSSGSGEDEPEAVATVSAIAGTALGATSTATATAIALGSSARSASATAEATSTCGPASTASATATTTAMRTTTSAISSADASNTDVTTPPTTKSEISGTDSAVAEAIATETATSSATSTFAEADER